MGLQPNANFGQCRFWRNEVAIQAEDFGIQSHGEAQQLWKVKDRKIDRGPFLTGGFGLHAVEVEMAERAGGDHDIRSVRFGIPGMGGDHGERVFFIDGQDGKAAASGLSGKVDDFCS